MAKVMRVVEGEGAAERVVGWMVFCPACQTGHLFDSRWTFDGNEEAPTFRASMLAYPEGRQGKARCHSFVTAGRIEFLADSTHALAGRTVDLPDFNG